MIIDLTEMDDGVWALDTEENRIRHNWTFIWRHRWGYALLPTQPIYITTAT